MGVGVFEDESGGALNGAVGEEGGYSGAVLVEEG